MRYGCYGPRFEIIRRSDLLVIDDLRGFRDWLDVLEATFDGTAEGQKRAEHLVESLREKVAEACRDHVVYGPSQVSPCDCPALDGEGGGASDPCAVCGWPCELHSEAAKDTSWRVRAGEIENPNLPF